MEEAKLQDHRLSEDSDAVRLVIVNGAISEHSSIGELPQGVYIGGLENAPNEAAEHLVNPCSLPTPLSLSIPLCLQNEYASMCSEILTQQNGDSTPILTPLCLLSSECMQPQSGCMQPLVTNGGVGEGNWIT